MTTNYIFVTGGVVSSLGKGIAAASLAAILEARGLKVTTETGSETSTSDQVLCIQANTGKCSVN